MWSCLKINMKLLIEPKQKWPWFKTSMIPVCFHQREKIKNIEIWTATKDEVEKSMQESMDKTGSVYDLVKSGARGSMGQLTQMAGMKGLIVNTAGETIDFPVISSNKEGLTPIEYFITTHGARKGLTDTALNTAKAGYLTRKLLMWPVV